MLTFFNLIAKLKNVKSKNGNIYMLIGNGTKNQFRYLSDLKLLLKKILSNVPRNSAFLYFGDGSNKQKPDIGYAFELLNIMRPDIKIYMIQIKEAQSWGVPKFVSDVYWHTDYNKTCKWGGLHNNLPCSNTKKWVNLNKYVKIDNVFILGGGAITLDEFGLIKKLNINYNYYIIERRFLGDGKTKINNNCSKKDKIGITYNKIKITK